MESISYEKAQELLPFIRKQVLKLQKMNEILMMMESVEIELDYANPEILDFLTKFNMSFHKLSYKFYQKLHEVEKLGCTIVDVDDGIVNFLSESYGRQIFLSWVIDEEKIMYWHEIDEEFEERKRFVNLFVE